jgi:hypothetical protein
MGMSRLERRRVFPTRRPSSPFSTPRSQGGPMRVVGRILVAVIVLSAVYLVLDFSGRIWAESYVAGQIQRSLQLSASPDVTFGGALFVPELLSGELSSAKVKANDFSSNGVQFTQATLELHDVRFSPGKLLFHKDATITAGSGSGSASMTDQQLTDAFRVQGAPVNVRFTPEGNVKLSASRFPVAVTVNATIRGGRLVLHPANPAFSRIAFTLDLPKLVQGLTYRSITFTGNLGVLSFGLRDAGFPVAPKSAG